MSDPSQQNGFVPLEKADFTRPPPNAVYNHAPVYFIFNNAPESSNNVSFPRFPALNGTTSAVPQNQSLPAWPQGLGTVPHIPQGQKNFWPPWLPPVTPLQMQNTAQPVWPQVLNGAWNNGPRSLPQVDAPQWTPKGEDAYARVVQIDEIPDNVQQQNLLAIGWKGNEEATTAPQLRRSARNTSGSAPRSATVQAAADHDDEAPERQRRESKNSNVATATRRSGPTDESSEEEDEQEKCLNKKTQAKASLKRPAPRRKPTVESDSSNNSDQDQIGHWMDGEEDSPDELPQKKRISRANQKKKVQKVEKKASKKRGAALSDSESDFEKEARQETKSKGQKKTNASKGEPKFYVPKRGKNSKS